MSGRRARVLIVWLICLAVAAFIVVRAQYITDLSAFLPRKPTPTQQLLVDQLRDGPASRLILIAIEGATSAARAKVSAGAAAQLRRDTQFASVSNGESVAEQGDREFLFTHRYLLSDAVSAERFSAEGLRTAIGDTIDDLASPAGLLFKSLLPRDPTGELPHIVDQLAGIEAPSTRDGVWVSKDASRALAVVQTVAAGSDTDAQARAIEAIRVAFAAALKSAALAEGSITLKMSGPGVFAVAARAKIEHAAKRLSIISSLLIVALLLAVYRSPIVLGLGLLPVASAALIGIAAVAAGFGAVHGITLGFGITLIGESVDYSIYYFIQSRRSAESAHGAASWQRQWWPTVRLGMLTSVCGFISLLPSGFPGLQQLGLYSISGLIAAALVTRFVLPELQPRAYAIHDVTPIGAAIERWLAPARRLNTRGTLLWVLLLAVPALAILIGHRTDLWNRELSALSPVSIEEQNFDTQLRADLGAADVRDIVVVTGKDLESALQAAEKAASALKPLIDSQVIARFDTPTFYLPSAATQEARRGSLPAAARLRDNLRQATNGLAVRADKLQPFLEDVEGARHGALLSVRDLRGTSMNAGFESMILHQKDRWNALLPLHSDGVHDIDLSKVAAALGGAALPNARVLDLKKESDGLYDDYLSEAIRLSFAGFVALTVLLLVTLRSALRVVRVLLPLALAVLTVAALLVLCGAHFTILHLVGMLLIVAVGSNYALFFDRQAQEGAQESRPLTLASLAIANAGTVIGFGLLSFSQVPVLVALGTTVAPGAFLALLFSALLARA
jgi:predicted exporter